MQAVIQALMGIGLGGFHTLTAAQGFDLALRMAAVAPEFIANPSEMSRETRLKLDDVIVKFEKEVGLI